MTCALGLAVDGKVYIGADSASVDGWETRQTALPKVFRRDGFLIAYTTSFRMGQLLQHHVAIPLQAEDCDDMSYMVCTFIESVRGCLKDCGFSEVDNNQESGGSFLVGYRGRLYSVAPDFQVNEMAAGVDAIGCGRQYALGAIRVLRHLPPEERIARALDVAAHYSGAVIPPFNILSDRG